MGGHINTLFTKGPSSGIRFLLAIFISLIVISVDQKTDRLDPLRYGLAYFATPFYIAGDIPSRISFMLSQTVTSADQLKEENLRLKQQVLLLQRRVQKLAAMSAENVRLRELLNSSDLVDESVRVAEIIGVDPDPARHEIIINHGADQGVEKGTPVLDAEGLMGQVIDVGPLTSRALLITDATHAIPVQVNRNGVRAIAVGSGSLDKLVLTYVPDTADIVEGDLLISSGLGRRFPEGYPVAKISLVEHHPGLPFAVIEAKPTARLDRSRHVLIVHRQEEKVSD